MASPAGPRDASKPSTAFDIRFDSRLSRPSTASEHNPATPLSRRSGNHSWAFLVTQVDSLPRCPVLSYAGAERKEEAVDKSRCVHVVVDAHQPWVAEANQHRPRRARGSFLNLNVFSVKTSSGWREARGQAYSIQKDHSGHGGTAWKLFNPSGKRVASLHSSGYVARID